MCDPSPEALLGRAGGERAVGNQCCDRGRIERGDQKRAPVDRWESMHRRIIGSADMDTIGGAAACAVPVNASVLMRAPAMSVAGESAIDPACTDAGRRLRPVLGRGFWLRVTIVQAQVIGNAANGPADLAPGVFDAIDRRTEKTMAARSALGERVSRRKAKHGRGENGDECLHCSTQRLGMGARSANVTLQLFGVFMLVMLASAVGFLCRF